MNRRNVTTMMELVLLCLLIVACGDVPTPIAPVANPVATETQLPPTITSTVAPTPTDTPTDTPTVTPTPVAGDFEVNTEGWGDHPYNGTLVEDQGVKQNCELPANTGNCSLEGNHLTGNQKDGGNNFYVSKFVDDSFSNKLISIWVCVPDPTLFSEGARHSTAKIIVWDNDYTSHEGKEIELVRRGCQEITYDLTGATFTTPYKEIGVHFFVQTDYSGPFYIDTVTAK